MGKNEEKQHKVQGELLEQICITSMFILISVLVVLPFLFLHLVFPMQTTNRTIYIISHIISRFLSVCQ